jgi:molybdopterin-containing oxidoreductase family membrane subunit
MTTMTQNKKNPVGMIWLVIVSLLTVVGIGAWVLQLQNGMGATGLTNLETWGLYIAGFIFFMGLSAGSLVLAALPVILDLPRLRPYAKIAAYTALISLVVGGLFILMDIGQPLRLSNIVAFGQLGSPLLWDLILTVVYLIVSTVYLLRLIQAERTGRTAPKWLAYVVLIAGLADGLTAFVFATQTAHEFWFSAIQPMTFEVAAIASAGGVLLFILTVLKLTGYLKLNLPDLKPVAVLTAIMLAVILLLLASEAVTLAFGQSESGLRLVNTMLNAPLFWVEVIALGAAFVLLLLPQVQTRSGGLLLAAALVVIGLAAKRLLFVTLGFSVPNIPYVGVDIGTPAYAVSTVEVVLTLGLVALFALLLTIGLRALPLKPVTKS